MSSSGAGATSVWWSAVSSKAIGTTLDELREARAHLEAHGIVDMRIRDHVVSQSIYVTDPDGTMVELYVDADPSTWRNTPDIVATSRPLTL
jgi:catechol-2,3-dioxygenase